MSNLLSDNTFLTITENIKNDDHLVKFMLVHKDSFNMLSTFDKNYVIKSMCIRKINVTDVIENMQNCGNIQMNKELFAITIETICARRRSSRIQMLNEFLIIHHDEHKTCNDDTRKHIFGCLCLDEKFNLNEYIETYCDVTKTLKNNTLDSPKLINKNNVHDETDKLWRESSEYIPVIIKSNIDEKCSSEILCDELPQKEEKCDKLNSDSAIICTYANNEEHVATLRVEYTLGAFDAVVDYLILHWGFNRNDIKYVTPTVTTFGQSYQLYRDDDNNRLVFINNDDGPVFNFVYSA